MANTLQAGQTAVPSAESVQRSWAAHALRRPKGQAFQHLLQNAMARANAHASIGRASAAAAAAQFRMAIPQSASDNTQGATASRQPDAALQQAMTLEGVPQTWKANLAYIMLHESGGQVDARSPVHSARGLFQLTAANYHFNPNGTASFGNAVEEVQGGIRYIVKRYGTADNAAAFWQQHHWY